MSHETDDSFPEPREARRPRQTLLSLEAENINPVDFVFNPDSAAFNHTIDDLMQKSVGEKTGALTIDLLQTYRDINDLNVSMNLNTVKEKLKNGKINHDEVFNLLDFFFENLQPVMPMTKGFCQEPMLSMIQAKMKLHEQCNQKLQDLQKHLDAVLVPEEPLAARMLRETLVNPALEPVVISATAKKKGRKGAKKNAQVLPNESQGVTWDDRDD